MGVDHDARGVIGEVIGKLIGETHVDQRGNCADAPARQQTDHVVHTVVGEDRDAVALAYAEMMKRAGEPLHGGDRLRIGQTHVAVNPPERETRRMALGVVQKELVHQHRSFSILLTDRHSRPGGPLKRHRSASGRGDDHARPT